MRIKILQNPTQIASKITKDNATIRVPILAPHTTDKYAKLKPKNIIPTSLTNANGLNSITVDTKLILHNAKAIF
ncbi:TPA: hypothetical protein DEP21_06615 [Patescibacteria group bacterium]|nr:hypothetical protein [Candidatus Gracilibacteria bacterium]